MTSWLLVFAALTLVLAAYSSGKAAVALDELSSGPVATSPKGQAKVSIRGFRNHKGQALVALFSGPKGFPDQGDLSMTRVARNIDSDDMELVFDEVPSGRYAVAILHDEDMDFEMKTGAFGIPKEGYGVSNNAKGRFGPPKYEDAVFNVVEGRGIELTITLIYH